MRMSSGPSARRRSRARPGRAASTKRRCRARSRRPADAALGEHAVHLAEALVDQGQARSPGRVTALRDRIGVAIEADHSSRPRPEQGARVAACSEGAVDQASRRGDGEAGDDLVEQDRHVRCRGGARPIMRLSPRSSSRKRAISFMSSGMRLSARNSFGFQIWKVSPAPRNRARSSMLALAAHHRRQDDAAGAVVGHFLGGAERHQVARLIVELGVGVGLLLLEQALDLRVLQRGVGGVVGAEAGEGVMLGKDDGAGIAAAFDDGAQEGGHGDATLRVDRVQAHCPETDALAPRPTPVRAHSFPVRGCTASPCAPRPDQLR